MDELAQELAGAVDRAEEEGRRSRFLGEIAGSIDLDEVLARTLEAAGKLPGCDAAMIRLEGHDTPIVATLGLSAEEAERQAIAGPPGGRPARSIEIVYRYPDGLPEAEELVHSGLAVPLSDDGGRAGYLTVFTRTAGRRFEDEDVRRLEELALRAGPAIENARRFREARQLADLDGLTGLHNRRYFHETLAREVARAHRYNRKAALIVFDLDDFKDVNDRIGHLAGRRRAGRGGRARPRRRPQRRHRLPRRRRRVRRDPAGVGAPGRAAAARADPGRRLRPADRRARDAFASPLDSPSCSPATTPSRSSSARTKRSTAPRRPARARRSPPSRGGGTAGTASGRQPPAGAGRPSRRWRCSARRAVARPSTSRRRGRGRTDGARLRSPASRG